MFYSQFILAKKGPLGTIWIAAHLERKLRKNQVADTDIGVSVDSILFPEVPIALRLSSHLLLGVVRIYSRKVNYLFDDCSEALLKVKQAFRSTAVDLPPEESTAPYHSITLPETFDLDDFELPDNEIFQGNYVDHHVSTREQITLQDTMEGVVYSTSQFGLDERFGDGDTSQIGLDLDEDLFVNKAAGYGNNEVSNADYQASVLPMEPLRMDKSDEGMTETSEAAAMIGNEIQSDDVAANTDFTAYAQAPSTPGLVEEPNLSSVQEGPACEDYLESDDRNLTGFIATENAGTASGKLYHHQGDKISSAVTMEHLACANNLGASSLTSDLAEKVKSISLVSECLDGDISAMDGPDEVEDIQNGVVTSNEPRVNSIDQTIAGYVESVEGRLDETVGGYFPPVTEGCLENDQASRPSIHNVVEITGTMEEYFSTHDSLGSNAARQLELSDRPEFDNVEVQACMEPKGSNALNPVHEEMPPICGHVLQACNSNMNQPDMPSIVGDNSMVVPNLPSQDVEPYSLLTSRREETLQASGASSELQGEEYDATNGMKPINEETQVSEPALHGEIQADCGKSDEQLGSAFSTDYELGNLNGSAISDLPTPEKLLSVPEGFTDKPNDLLVESTPDKEIQNDADTSGAGTNFISGKKRSLTESVVTMQSLRTVESYGVTQSKKTAESIPDDDDLLSSILVGRRSSVLKMKPTPPAPEIASSKRLRSAPRASVLKRKVLMDDTMVLHGDTIRQQLTSTEDIRRVRKKAPCTRPEISIIQRQLLEVDIFNVHVFTGMSADLVCLYSEAYDPSIIRTSEIVENNTSSEAKKDVESSVRQNVTEESGTAVTTEPGVIRNDMEAQPAETPVHIQSQNDEDHNLVCDDSNTEMQTKAVTDILELETPKNIADMEIDKGSFEVADAENRSIIHGFEPSLSTDPVSRDSHNIPADVVDQALLDKTNHVDAIQMDESCMSPAKKFDPYPTEDASIVGISNGKGSDTGDVTEHNAGSHIVGTESRVRDELLLDESKGDASILIREDVHTVCAQPADNAESSLVTDGCNYLDFVNGDQAAPEIGEEKSGVVNGDENLTWESGYDDKNPASNHICSRDPDIDCSYPVELDIDMKNSSLNEGENPGWQEVYQQSIMDAEFTSGDYIAAEDGRDFENISLQNDTEFLNVDDDEVAEDDDDCEPSAEETRLHENSGWSSRTRAVAKYLQTLYDKEAVHGRKVLLVDNLLAGKTRKEASRMFFETLVLKTRDYIQVEQAIPFDNINIKPRMKLMKSDF